MQANPTLLDVYKSFTGGKMEMDSKPYAKLYKDCGLLDKKLTAVEAELNFAKCKPGKVKSLTFEQFQKTLELAATKKGTTKEALIEQICSKGGPKYTGTKADYVKFHDDKSTYTGVYAKGGPSTVDAGRGGMVSDISQICDRTKADVRGVKK
jgi:hypothetical protein